MAAWGTHLNTVAIKEIKTWEPETLAEQQAYDRVLDLLEYLGDNDGELPPNP